MSASRPAGADRGGGTPGGTAALAAVVAAVACCAIPLLVAAGLITTAGVALRNLAVAGVGVALFSWLVARVARHARTRRSAAERSPHNRPAATSSNPSRQGARR